jgi:hypothetical protein
MPEISSADRVVFAAVQSLCVLRHPRITQSYWKRRGHLPDFARPTGLGEMVQWRKAFDHNPQFIVFCDKLATKRWVASNFPDVPLIQPLWVGEHPEDIPDDLVQAGYVVKTNHGCRSNYFPHRQALARPELNRLLRRWLRRSYDRQGQWGYRHIERRLFVEPRIGGDRPLTEYSIRCHDGAISGIFVVNDQHRETEQGSEFSDDGERFPAKPGAKRQPLPPDYVMPQSLHQARDMASRISRGYDHLRIDFLVDGDDLYLGEITVYPGSGYGTEWQLPAKAAMHEHAWFRALHVNWFYRTPQPWPISIYQAAFRRFADAHLRELDTVSPSGGPAHVAPVSGPAPSYRG